MSALLAVRDLGKRFSDGRRALDGVSLDVHAGEVVALVGESGSGKSTLARVVCGLVPADEGQVLIAGQRLRRAGTRVQMVFQDPFASLNPVHTVEHHLLRPLARRLRQPAAALRAEAARLLAAVGLEASLAARHPHALSGGQRQRVAIARALAAGPEVILADEPTSMLDVSTRLGVLTLLRRLADERRLGILFITHDLASAAAIADRVLTMYAGRVVESGATATVLGAPSHPYTRLLLASAPRGERILPRASSPSSLSSPSRSAASSRAFAAAAAAGCPFVARCPDALPCCPDTPPANRTIAADHHVRCHLYQEGASEHAALS
ncbi:MAG: oligopeptide/dipeptide transporter ATP-binding protein [Myxococcales bacterium]|nr:oligopeptide/dipeptide transporter ATP-binding protein [Myxococcales bacterium]